MSTLYILNYNNYYNRILKKESSLANYLAEDSSYVQFTNINFYKADGVNTEQTVNFLSPYSEKDGDYLIVTDGGTPENIVSRWFIIENEWNRKGQLRLTLRRDILIDYYDSYATQPFFCEKGVVGSSDPFIFNSENMYFNQVLTGYSQLYENNTATSGYLVGFVANNTPEIEIPQSTYREVENIENEPWFQYSTQEVYEATDGWVKFTTQGFEAGDNSYGYNCYQYGVFTNGTAKSNSTASTGLKEVTGGFNANYHVPSSSDYETYGAFLTTAMQSATVTAMKQFVDSRQPLIPTIVDEFDGTYFVHKGFVYKIEKYQTSEKELYPGETLSVATINQYKNSISTTSYPFTVLYYDGWRVGYAVKGYRLRYYQTGTVFTFPEQTPSNSAYVPYNMFYCPYSETSAKFWAYASKYLSSGGYLYDFQLVPYEPPASIRGTSFTINNITCTYLTYNTYNTTLSVSNPSYVASQTAKWKKRTSLTDMLRLVSPDYSSSFDINPRQAGLNSSTISFACSTSLKPFGTQMWIRPAWNELYGISGQADNRGLVYSGSFSLPMITDQWLSYQANNSSYADSFNRSIENMSITQDVQRKQEIWSAIAGGVSGATSGMTSGFLAGGVAGAVAGGVIGAGVSAIGGIADYQMNEKLRNEAIDYAKDQFGYNCRNIQARANSLTTSGSFSCLNHIFPALEYYTCTTEEATAWDNKALYNGWSIGRIGTFSEFHGNVSDNTSRYIKGSIIRISGSEDTHLFNNISSELNKGVFDNL